MIELDQNKIMENWGCDNSDNPLVSIKCMTYNQESYIEQTLDGFLMQKTTFPFEILVHDDASTDTTVEIIQRYEEKFPRIVKGIYESENQWSKGNRAHHKKINDAIKGKYIAFCEGDDYWIDCNKLQKQVSFLEKHKDFGMCYTKARVFYQESNEIQKESIGSDFISYNHLFVKGNVIPALTTCFRTDLYRKYLNEIFPDDKNWAMGDLPCWLWFLKNSKVQFIPRITGVYRVLRESASHSQDEEKQKEFINSSFELRKFFADLYGDEELLKQYSYYCDYNSALQENNVHLMKELGKLISKVYLSQTQITKNILKVSLRKFVSFTNK